MCFISVIYIIVIIIGFIADANSCFCFIKSFRDNIKIIIGIYKYFLILIVIIINNFLILFFN